ncbi:transcription factor [Neolentinus lepideus HHB14362 ss-1]|uniref:Transcription factor n=1 Tax=Neolentinus lepideus HHB14362 ss-1 TaxID=1314782 RepID=A0A165TQ15_9AGAM|nr:transcription factor [Neolentinus lepideus HHB14362 ss-1]
MPDNQIFKATYSGIPVYEMMCKSVAVMRRRSDSWLNATQILKVAGFDKPQRTRILEREVQKGEHEKVQGGYGKYQGTWIPLHRGLELCKQYNCEQHLRPLIDFTPAAESPPLAPKHLVAAPGSRPSKKAAGDGPGVATRSSRRTVADVDVDSEEDSISVRASEDGTLTPSPSEGSSSSRTPSPIRSPGPDALSDNEEGGYQRNGRPRKRRRSVERDDMDIAATDEADGQQYAEQILEYFISDTNQIPKCLIEPPPDFDPNVVIDDDGHTPLHWAAAMGRLRIVKLLLTAGADKFRTNNAGQTCLMRSVMFANNYDVRKFPELFELLHGATLNIDNANRTVFHHIVDVAMSKGKTHAARYYMESILNRLAQYPLELKDIINFQDEDGETALTMAARCRSKRLVKLLIDHGADPKIVNSDGKSAEDYILEDERFRSSPILPSRALGMSFRNAHAAYPHGPAPTGYAYAPASGDKLPLHFSVAAQRTSTRCMNDVTAMLDSLAQSFDEEFHEKEKDMTQAHATLAHMQTEILESQRNVAHLKAQAGSLNYSNESLQELEQELLVKMGKRYRLGWEKWVKDEEDREKAIRDAAGGALHIPSQNFAFHPDESMNHVEVTTEKSERKGKRKAASQPEDINDLIALHSDVPADPEALHQACEVLRQDLDRHRKRRRELFEEFVKHQEESGTEGKMAEYRRLISIGCGGIPPQEVDSVLPMLLEALEAEEPSSSIPWSSSAPPPRGPGS